MELWTPALLALCSLLPLAGLPLAGDAAEMAVDGEIPDRPAGAAWIDFADGQALGAWRQVHDGVMGGLSTGTGSAGEGFARFRGAVSLENNGGFASFRAGAELPEPEGVAGLRLAVRGDGQTYRLNLRTDGRWDGVSWQSSFATEEGAWRIIDLDFESFVPTWRGRLVAGAAPLEPQDLAQIGISIADKQAGPFALEVAWIDPFLAAGEPQPGSLSAHHQRTLELQSLIDGGGADAEALADRLADAERLIVLALPGDLDVESSLLRGTYAARASELAERELRVVMLFGDGAGRLAGRTLEPEQVRGLREGWGLPRERWVQALVGKDGGVKGRWTESLPLDALLGKIDAMPMRRAEAAERGGDSGRE